MRHLITEQVKVNFTFRITLIFELLEYEFKSSVSVLFFFFFLSFIYLHN